MPQLKTEILTLKKVKKNGSIESEIMNRIIQSLRNDELALYPVDSIYGILCLLEGKYAGSLHKLAFEKEEKIEILVSDFKMLESLVILNKFEFDFLHRIWPGEISVKLTSRKNKNVKIMIRIPRSRFQLEIISALNKPILYATLYNKKGKHVYTEKEIIKLFSGKVNLITIIKEFCKEHVMPSIVDITKNDLEILKEGRVPEDEIKSLYFLGQDDEDDYI